MVIKKAKAILGLFFQVDYLCTSEFTLCGTKLKKQFFLRHLKNFLLVQIVDHSVPEVTGNGILTITLNGGIHYRAAV